MYRERAVDMMQAVGLDAVVASSPIGTGYLTGYRCWINPLFKQYMTSPGAPSGLAPLYSVFTPDAEACLIIDPIFAVNAQGLGVSEIRSFGSTSLDLDPALGEMRAVDQKVYDGLQSAAGAGTPTEALLGFLRDHRLMDARIGIEMESLDPAAREQILESLPKACVKDCSNLIRLMRMVKSPHEIRLLERAASIGEQSAMLSFSAAEVGTPMMEIAERFRVLTTAMGAEFDHLAYGHRGMGIATRTTCLLREGDYEYVDYGCIYEGYFSDAGVTLAVGDLPPDAIAEYRALVFCEARAMELIRPGVRSSVLANAMQSSLIEAGIRSSFPHGHGVGLEVRDYPIIVPDNGLRIRDDCLDLPSDLPLEAGMVICLEASIFKYGVGSLHCEQIVLVTADGCRPLVPQDRSMPVLVS